MLTFNASAISLLNKPFFINRKTSNSRFVKVHPSVSDKSINICSPVLKLYRWLLIISDSWLASTSITDSISQIFPDLSNSRTCSCSIMRMYSPAYFLSSFHEWLYSSSFLHWRMSVISNRFSFLQVSHNLYRPDV